MKANPHLRKEILHIVENQLKANNLKETRITYNRLERKIENWK